MSKHSTNEKAAMVVGYRSENVIAIDFPCEIGFHCPVCEYQLETNGEYDERLQWSEYNAFIWCEVCDKDYPSTLCAADIDTAIDIFLRSVEDARETTTL